MALQVFITDILDAIKTGDTRRANELIASLILENDATWFVSQFTAETNSLLLAAYKQSTNDFVNTTRELYTADMQRGPIEVRVNRYDDVNHAPQPITEILRNMTVPEPLYEVSLSGNRPTFQIAVPSNGAPSRVIAGDLDGYFVETAQGFRFIPSNVLEVAVRELQKSRYEVLSRDTDGRATRIRIGAAALIGLLVDRVQSQYPRTARQKKIEGEVIVSALIGKNGRVEEVRVISGPPELHDAALDAMKKWRFKPFQLDGRAVEVQSNFVFNYSRSQ